MKALIADDKPANLYLLETMLKGIGIDAIQAKNGLEALGLLRSNRDIKLIISDILMPEMDGFQFCIECKKDQNLNSIPFIFYTATYTDSKDEAFARSLGADAFILKPIDPQEFMAILMNILEEVKVNKFAGKKSAQKSEVIVLKKYNQALIRKLEEKMVALEKANTELDRSRIFFKTIFSSSCDAMTVSDADGILTFFNEATESMFGYTKDEIIGLPISQLAPEHLKDHQQQLLKKAVAKGYLKAQETEMVKKDGTVFPVEVSFGNMHDTSGELLGIVAIFRDITKRKLAQQQIQQDLQEKTILLAEIHHRVKNSLQVVASLLNLQSHEITDKHSYELFQESRNRVRMMSSVYERLYQSEKFADIDFGKYLDSVLIAIYQQSGLRHRVDLKIDVMDIKLGLDDAIPVALIINELFTNSIKYAFPDESKGKIEIIFKQLEDKSYQLIYRDNGVGLPKEIDFKNTKSFGLFLVNILTKQITGTAALEQTEWTTFTILFKG